MADMKNTARISRPTTESAFLVKYWAALVLFISAISMGGKDVFVYPARIPLVAALAVAGVFCLTAAEVRNRRRRPKVSAFSSLEADCL
jgi:hypothetical protein